MGANNLDSFMISGLVDQIATMLESCDVENLRKAIKDYLDTVLQKIATK